MRRLILCAGLLPFAPMLSPSAEASAKVTISATSSLGDALPCEVHLYRLGSLEDLWAERGGRGKTAEGIPFGWYQLQVLSPGFRKYERSLAILDPDTHIRAVMAVSLVANGTVELSERLLHSDNRGTTWVLAFPLEGSPADVTESMVGADGAFHILTLYPGPYLLAVVRGGKTLNTQQAYLGAKNAELVIDLSR